MTEKEVKLVIGGLLHDIGKVIYRTGDGRKHSKSGYDYLVEEVGLEDREVLESVLYHHKDALKSAQLQSDSNAYITYIADNIASGTDRRKREKEDYGFEMTTPLQPVFNILNGNNQDAYYHPMMLENTINYPTEEKIPFNESFYRSVKEQITDSLRGLEWTEQYVNSLLSVLEATLCFVPSSTAKGEVADVSLFDHVKLTAAANSCIYQYLADENVDEYDKVLFKEEKEFYDKKVFLLYSIDVSGIQNFIYTIQSKDALKMLRARSFYLEFMMEHIIDSLIERLGMSRANLIYSGGGHCYMLLPNTATVKQRLDDYEKEVNTWLQQKFDVALYIASGYVEATADNLKNIPEKSYEELYHNLSSKISGKKAKRYSAKEIIELNRKKKIEYSRECSVCKRLESVNDDGICDICEGLKKSSKDILYQPFFVVSKTKEENCLPLPGDCYLLAESENNVKKRIKDSSEFVRIYTKNQYYTGLNVATKIWVGNYTKGQTFEEFAETAEGIDRIGVVRADVDNLGQTFVSGFSEQYNTLSRTATLSRHLSLFFKYYINNLLEQGQYGIRTQEKQERNATIVYSGGDDLFIVGAWNDTIELVIDIRNALEKYTQGTLTLSAGIGVYGAKYPISRIAQEVGELEDFSKKLPGKAAVTIFPDGTYHKAKDGDVILSISDGTYSWKEFVSEVIESKYACVRQFFEQSADRGKSFLYHLLELIRGREQKINFARYVYVLARMEPDNNAPEEQKLLYKEFAKQMYCWIQNEKDCRQLRTAMNMYAYMIRDNNDEEGYQYDIR